MLCSETAVEISILDSLFPLRVQIICITFLVRTGKQIKSNSKCIRCLTSEENLSFYLMLVSLRKVKAVGGKNQHKTTRNLTKILKFNLSPLVRWTIISPRNCVPPSLWSNSETLWDRQVACVPLFWKITGIKSTLSLNSCPNFHSHQ